MNRILLGVGPYRDQYVENLKNKSSPLNLIRVFSQ